MVGSRRAASMNRTIQVVAVVLCFGLTPGLCQESTTKPTPAPQADPIEALVAGIRTAEQRATSVRVELATRGTQPGGHDFSTTGTLSVLRGTQPKMRSSIAFSWANGLDGRMETAQTADGIVIYQEDLAFGEVLVRIAPPIVVDLEWAGGVLDRSDLPGMKDGRAAAPLGSAMLDDLRVHFELKLTERKERAGETGVWLVGERRAGLGDQDPELPLASRVEAFVRQRDQAVLEVLHYQGDKILQRIEVKKLEVDVPMAEAEFVVDARGQKMRDVTQYPPLWELIEKVLLLAESKAGEGVVRPSLRKR